MNRENRAAWMTGVQKIEMGPSPYPVLKPGWVIIKVEYVGVCGSDVHFYESGLRKGEPIPLPFILGHECAGTVTEVAEDVTTIAVGDRVCFEPQITCGRCRYCRSGHYNMCPDVQFPSVPPYNGMLQKYAAIPAANAFRLPDNLSTKDGALIEPLAVGLSAAERGDVTLGQTVVILGAGCIGLLTMLSCRARGAARILVADLFENRLEKAKELGADVCVNTKETDIREAVSAFTGGEGADVVFETAGSVVTAEWTPYLVRRAGVVVMVGNVNAPASIDLMELMYKDSEIRTIYRYRNNFQTALNAVSAGRIPIRSIISAEYEFAQTNDAFRACLDKKAEITKVVVKVQ